MITAETKDGFAVELSEEALDNVELLDALAAVQDSDVLSLGRTIRLLDVYKRQVLACWQCSEGKEKRRQRTSY